LPLIQTGEATGEEVQPSLRFALLLPLRIRRLIR